MSGYNTRKTPNVSQYIANLNTIPSAHDLATQQEGYQLDDDLAIFTNAEFFDFDLGENIDQTYDPARGGRTRRGSAGANAGAVKGLNFENGKCPDGQPTSHILFYLVLWFVRPCDGKTRQNSVYKIDTFFSRDYIC